MPEPSKQCFPEARWRNSPLGRCEVGGGQPGSSARTRHQVLPAALPSRLHRGYEHPCPHISCLLRLWLSRKEGVGSKPRKLLSPETKIHGFSSWCSESSSLKKPQQTPSQHETAKVNEREKACLVLSMCPFLDGIALCYCLCKQMWKACNWNRENRGRETWERKQFHQGRVGSQWQSKN